MNNALLLSLVADEKKLLSDLAICLEEHWKEHFNTRDYSGSWNAIALRSMSGRADDILASNTEQPFVNTPLLKKCSYFNELLEQLHCEKETVRLLRLHPNSEIKEHRDQGLAYRFGVFRLHLPIVTDAAVAFMVGGANVPMKKGECWYADFDLPHSVVNNSAQERIHLVIDGKRNSWTDVLFKEAGYDFEEEARMLEPSLETKLMMLEQLKHIHTPAALQLIEKLKQEVELHKQQEEKTTRS